MFRSRRAVAAAMGSVLLASMALTPATVAQTPTDLSLWVFVDRHARFIESQAELWNAANPIGPSRSPIAMSMPRLSNKSRSQNSRRSKPSSLLSQKKQEAEQARQTAQGQADAAVIASKGAAEARLIQAQSGSQSQSVAVRISHTHLVAISIYFETRSRRADHFYSKRQSVHFAAA